jgi:hypothetical protein
MPLSTAFSDARYGLTSANDPMYCGAARLKGWVF